MKKKINIFHALLISFSVLSRIPVPFAKKLNYSKENLALSMIFFPVVGLFFGFIIYTVYKLMIFLFIPLLIQAFIILLIPYILNKFFHFDGLADVIDAFFADKTKEERLVILKDSRTGSFALGGMIFFVLLKFILIYLFLSKENLFILYLFIPVISRFSMILLSFKSKYPRAKGTGSGFVGNVTVPGLLVSFFIVLFIAACLVIAADKYFYSSVIVTGMIVSTVILSLLFKIISYNKIGGITGDTLGALNEITGLLMLVILQFI